MKRMKRKMMAMRMMPSVLVVLAGLALGVQSVAQSVAPDGTKPAAAATPGPDTSAKTSGPEFRDRYPRYKIEAGDQFDVTFDLSPEFNQTVTVQPDGYVTLRGVGDLHVQGQTVPELTQTLRTVYGKILNEPIIAVVLKDFEKPYFIADGQVGKPGKYELRGDMTLTEAIAMAGGFQDTAKHSQVLLFRKFNDQWTEAKMFNVKQMEKTGNLKEDPFLHPGDMLFVPKNAFSKIKPFIPNGSVGTFLSPIK
jgi:polysaccharide biosynthesis/export protein